VPVRGSLNTFNARTHRSLQYNCERPLSSDCSSHCLIDRVKVFAVHIHGFDPVTFECLTHVVAFEVLGRVASDCHVVVVDEKFHVQAVGRSNASSFSGVSLHLRAVGAEGADYLVRIAQGDPVDHRPDVTQAPRTEFDARGAAELGMARQLRMALPILQQLPRGHVSP